MKPLDIFRYAMKALTGYPTRTLLMLLAMTIGVSSVVILSTLGDGARKYVINEFSALGTNLLIVLPGRSETVGGPPPLLGITPRDLTLDDALALQRSSTIRYISPIMVGAAPVSRQEKSREVTVLGSTAAFFLINQLTVAQGHLLPEDSATRASSVCLLGHKIKQELFGNDSALGETLRIGDRRFQVIGVLSNKGRSIGMDIGDLVLIPVTSAQALFNRTGLFRIALEAADRSMIQQAKKAIQQIIRDRHDGEDDVTIISQDAVLATFDRIFSALTMTVSGIAAISLAVAGILIMNVMLIAVSQRKAEVGLLKAIGAPNHQVMILFLVEAAILSLVGAVCGLLFAALAISVVARFFPAFPLAIPLWAGFAATGIALFTGLVFGVLPAKRAASLDPVLSLSRR